MLRLMGFKRLVILDLLQYTPKSMLEQIKMIMRKLKKAYEEGVREL
jgi:hypothetical protein